MRGADRLWGLLTLAAIVAAPADLAADAKLTDRVRTLTAALHRAAPVFSDTVTKPLPQSIPSTGDDVVTVDLRDVSRPYTLEARLRPLARMQPEEIRVRVVNGQARLGDYGIGSEQVLAGDLLVIHGNVDVSGELRGNLVAYDGDVVLHRGARVQGDVVSLRGEVRNDGATVTGNTRMLSAGALARALERETTAVSPAVRAMRNLAGVSGVFLILLLLAWAAVFFARDNVEIVSDTVRFSFTRAVSVGLLGQVLAAPTFGMLIVGLILSVAGILLLPFAIIAFALLLIVTVLGGGLAASHAMGETVVRRRLALGAIGAPTGYRAALVGLAMPTTLWMLWAVFSWVPVAGTLMLGGAALATWLIVTAGFGAALLSRAGARENFAGRLLPPEAMTDEFLWATPQYGVPAVKRPASTSETGRDRASSTSKGGGRTD